MERRQQLEPVQAQLRGFAVLRIAGKRVCRLPRSVRIDNKDDPFGIRQCLLESIAMPNQSRKWRAFRI